MEHVAIVERQLRSWFVHLPELGLGVPVGQPGDAADAAVRLIASTTGLPPAGMRVAVHLIRQSDVLVSTPSSPVRARHLDGAWHAGECRGWVRQSDRSWRALVSYVVDGVGWERTVDRGQFASRGDDRWPEQSPPAGSDGRAAHVAVA